MHSTTFFIVAIVAIVAQAYLLFLFFFEPGLRYRLETDGIASADSDDFIRALEALTDSRLCAGTSVEVLTNGDHFYIAELDAIAAAQRTVNLEAYIFQRGEIASRFLQALTERARAGVGVKVVLDAFGSAGTFKSELKQLREAGGNFAWYHPLRWNTIPNFNNRTHRELMVVDGRIAFVGGAGIADHWLLQREKKPRWRDTMCRIEGPAVAALQSTFAENWLESCDEILVGTDYFPQPESTGGSAKALVVSSTPSVGGSTRARVLFQLLIAAAQKRICITTPYFLPDISLRKALARAASEGGVDVRLVVPGKKSDHFQTRHSSHRFFGQLLKAGAQVFEYQPAMIHAKVLIVDGQWSVVGSTNFDSRSFRINDEVNVAVFDSSVAARLEQDFARDVANSKAISYEQWRQRSLLQRLDETMAMVFERQE